MSYAIVGFGKIGQALAHAFARKNIDEAETERWKAVAQPTVDQWFADTQAKGVDGKTLHEKAKALIAAESGM